MEQVALSGGQSGSECVEYSITVVDARYYFEDYTRLIKDDLITDVLFMNNTNTFVQDTSLADMLEVN